MAVEQFAQENFVRVLESNEVDADLGSFVVPNNKQIRYIETKVFIRGTLAGTEKLTMELHHSRNNNQPAHTSAERDLTAAGITGSNYYGTLRFDFTDDHIDPDQRYYVKVTATGYTRTGDTDYISFVYDWPYPVNDPTAIYLGVMSLE